MRANDANLAGNDKILNVVNNGIGIDKITNRFILDKSVGLYSNPNATVIITKLDKLSCELNIPEGQSINVEWQIVPRYL